MMRTTVQRWTMSFSLKRPELRRMLGRPDLDHLLLTPSDPWPCDAENAADLLQGILRIGTRKLALADLFGNTLSDGLFARVHGFGWLRDLRALGSLQARAAARHLIMQWLESGALSDHRNTEPALVGERLANWLAAYAFYSADADTAFIEALLNGVAVQFDLLPAALTRPIDGIQGLAICQGLLAVTINLDGQEKLVAQAVHQVQIITSRFLLPDGGTKMRAPSIHLQALQYLLNCRRLLLAAHITVPDSLTMAITAMAAALRLLRHGDGGLALFHGGCEGQTTVIDAVLGECGQLSRRRFSLPASGYERVAAGRAVLVVDTGPPPPRAMHVAGHASASSLEFSVGRERVLVNCGAAECDEPQWQKALAATAAHSAVVVRDANICDPRSSKGVRRLLTVRAQRYEQDGFDCVDVTHDGYHDLFGVMLRRIVALDHAGDRLIGREIITGATNIPYVLRLHLHPTVQALPALGGQSVLLKLPSGAGWRLRATQGQITLEPSIYAPAPGLRQPTQQIAVHAATTTPTAILDWILEKETR